MVLEQIIYGDCDASLLQMRLMEEITLCLFFYVIKLGFYWHDSSVINLVAYAIQQGFNSSHYQFMLCGEKLPSIEAIYGSINRCWNGEAY